MQHHASRKIELSLRHLFGEVDAFLEDKFGDRYSLHPARAPRGTTSHYAHDGLFDVGASFSAGYGSRFGRGYVIDVRMVTLEWVPEAEREEIIDAAVEKVRELLPRYFPDRDLAVSRDRQVFKIHGDLSLGRV